MIKGMLLMNFRDEYMNIREEILHTRRTIHANPELGFEEFQTAQTIKTILNKYHISYIDQIAKTGICATIGNSTEKVLLIRADMDALPIEEKTQLEYASEKNGLMHACGHDIHISSALAAAIILKKFENKLNGTVKIVFQPAEETTGGAKPMINEGIMDNPKVTAAIGGHVSGEYPAGIFKVKSGPIMASPDDFMVRFIGKSTHGAEPQNGISPITPACEFVNSLEYIRNELCEGNSNVLSICTVSSNGGVNTIPDDSLILGTFRCFDEETRKKASGLLKKHAENISAKYRCKSEFKYNFLYPPVINDPILTEFFVDTAKELYGEKSVITLEKPFMTGDDFAYFGQNIPAIYFWYGAMKNNPCSLHSSKFDVSEDAIEVCTNVFTKFALDYLR